MVWNKEKAWVGMVSGVTSEGSGVILSAQDFLDDIEANTGGKITLVSIYAIFVNASQIMRLSNSVHLLTR